MTRCALGIDPGTARMGFAIVAQQNNILLLRSCGVLETHHDVPLAERLGTLYAGLLQLIDQYEPTEMAVEELFFNRNVRSALSVGQARGAALLAANHRHLAVASYTPLQVKDAVTGFGRASKDQIQEMVRILLNLDVVPRPDDAADAAAIAICHLTSAHARETYLRLAEPPRPRVRGT